VASTPPFRQRFREHTTDRQDGTSANLANIPWLIVSFGEYQVMAQPIVKRVLISCLINKDFSVRHLPLAHGNFAAAKLNHQM
jgi:hypothetical protein